MQTDEYGSVYIPIIMKTKRELYLYMQKYFDDVLQENEIDTSKKFYKLFGAMGSTDLKSLSHNNDGDEYLFYFFEQKVEKMEDLV